MIRRINERFVSTTITYYDLLEVEKTGDVLAKEVAANWSNPVSLMFLTPEGKYVTKLTLLKELLDIHPDTTFRPGQTRSSSADQNEQIFLKHLDEHFRKAP